MIIDFITENWRFIVEVSIAVASLLIVLLRKRVKVYDSIREYILSLLPAYIKIAEDLGGEGDYKKTFVLNCISNHLKDRFDCFDIDPYIDFINDSIESILSTPQKKGVK